MATVGTRYLEQLKNRSKVMGAQQGDPFATPEQVSNRLTGLGAGAFNALTEGPLWLMNIVGKE